MLFALLVAFTSRWTVFEAEALRDNPPTGATLLEEQRDQARRHPRRRRQRRWPPARRARQERYRAATRRASCSPTRSATRTSIRALGLEEYYNDPLTGRRTERDRRARLAARPARRGDDLQHDARPAGPAGRARRRSPAARARVVALDVKTGAVRVMASDAVVRPERLDDPATPRSTATRLAAAQPRDPGPLPAGLDVQGRDRDGGARPRQATRPTRTVDGEQRQADLRRAAAELRRRGLRHIDLTDGADQVRQHRVGRGRREARQARRCASTWSASASTRTRRSTTRTTRCVPAASTRRAAGCSRRPPAGRRRPHGDRPGQALGHAAADGDGRADDRQRRRADEAAARSTEDHRPRRAHDRRARARGGRARDVRGDRARADGDDEATWCARAPARRPRSRASRWRARPARRSSTTRGLNDLWFIGFAGDRSPSRSTSSAAGRQGRHRRRADRQAGARGAGASELSPCATSQRDTVDRRALPRRSTRIGSGGMADVYCAEDHQLGRKVALKLLHRRFAEDEEFVERFRREASTAAGLQHPNVVRVFDRGEWDGTYYIAMEFLEGRSLKQIIREEGAARPDARDRHRDPGPARRALRPQARDHPPRHQAAQRDRRRRGPRQGHGLRHRPRRRVGHDGDRLDHGHRAVPVARAGAGPRRSPRARTSTRSGSCSTSC